jgi:membrane protein DedA with SNARE-associated domain
VAIPRYLAKRARRVWDHDLMHPTRSDAAHRRPRNGGQFGAVVARFIPAAHFNSLRPPQHGELHVIL